MVQSIKKENLNFQLQKEKTWNTLTGLPNGDIKHLADSQ